MSQSAFDIVIVGAGLVGSALACRLAKANQHWRIAVVDTALQTGREPNSDFDPRVVALTESSRLLLEQQEVWAEIAKVRACPYQKMYIWDGEGSGNISFDAAEYRVENLGHIVENRVVLQVLQKKIQKCKNVSFVAGKVAELSDQVVRENYYQLQLESGQVLLAQLIVAADGAKSTLRNLAGIVTREWTYHQRAIVTTVKTEKSHAFTARQRFMASGPLAFLPLQQHSQDTDGNYSSIVWSADTEFAESLMQLNDEAFCDAVTRAFEGVLGDVVAVEKRHCIALMQRHGKTYVANGVVLVGDAAHSIHPLAGQGVNLGLKDVECLAQELLRATKRNIPLGDAATLRRYQRQRMPGNLTMMVAMESFKRLFGSRSLSLLWLRNFALRRVNNISALKNLLAREAMGLK